MGDACASIDNPIKICACTGQRWCARCEDEVLRAKHGLHPLKDKMRFEAVMINAPGQLRNARWFGDVSKLGLQVYENVLSKEQQRVLVEDIEKYQWRDSVSGRLKQSFGPSVNFKAQKAKVTNFHGVPQYCEWLFALLKSHTPLGIESMDITSCFVQKYIPDLKSHFDFHTDDTFAYGDRILGVSLLSDSYLSLYPTQLEDVESCDRKLLKVKVPKGSVFLLDKEVRYDWRHAILPDDIQETRISITLRESSDTLKQTESGRSLKRI